MARKILPLTRDDVTFSLNVEQDDSSPDFQSGCPEYKEEDDQLEQDVRDRLDSGDVWAWAYVSVTARWGSFSASAGVGGCSYCSEEDFQNSGEQKELENQALERLNDTLESIYHNLNARAVEVP